MENKYLAVIEAIGELLIIKNDKIKYQQYEIELLKSKLHQIEKQNK